MKVFWAIIITLLVLAFWNPGKQHWEDVGPRWACALNPAKYDFCTERE